MPKEKAEETPKFSDAYHNVAPPDPVVIQPEKHVKPAPVAGHRAAMAEGPADTMSAGAPQPVPTGPPTPKPGEGLAGIPGGLPTGKE